MASDATVKSTSDVAATPFVWTHFPNLPPPNVGQFQPDANESDNHRKAKQRLYEICMANGIQASVEHQIPTEYKTYYCDVLAVMKFFGAEMKLDLEVEDHDHSAHDYSDADNKVKELKRYFIKIVWFKSADVLKFSKYEILAKILYEMQDGHEQNPRFNI